MEKYLAKLEEQTNSPYWPGATPPPEMWERARALFVLVEKEAHRPSAPHVHAHVDGVILFLWGDRKNSVKVELNHLGVVWNIETLDDPVIQTGSSSLDSDVVEVIRLVFEGPRHSLLPIGHEKHA